MNIFAPLALYDRLAAKFFVPLAIKLCHLCRVTQYQLHDYLWLLFYWTVFTMAVTKHAGFVGMTVITLLTMYWTVKVATMRYSDESYHEVWPWLSTGQRRAALLLETYHSGVHILYALGFLGASYAKQASFDMSCPMLWYVLVADYAITIRHLPPREEREPHREPVHQNS